MKPLYLTLRGYCAGPGFNVFRFEDATEHQKRKLRQMAESVQGDLAMFKGSIVALEDAAIDPLVFSAGTIGALIEEIQEWDEEAMPA